MTLYNYKHSVAVLNEVKKTSDYRLKLEIYHTNFDILNTFMDDEITHEDGDFIYTRHFDIWPKNKYQYNEFNKYVYKLIEEIIIRTKRFDFCGYHKLNKKYEKLKNNDNIDLYSCLNIYRK